MPFESICIEYTSEYYIESAESETLRGLRLVEVTWSSMFFFVYLLLTDGRITFFDRPQWFLMRGIAYFIFLYKMSLRANPQFPGHEKVEYTHQTSRNLHMSMRLYYFENVLQIKIKIVYCNISWL